MFDHVFILNEEAFALLRSGKSTLNFRYDLNGCLSTEENTPEAAVAYEEEAIQKLFQKNGLGISQPIHYGSCCNRQQFLTYRDMIIASK